MGDIIDATSKRLFDSDSLNISNVKMFPGSSRDTTADQFATHLNMVLSRIESGDFEIVDDED